MKKFLKKFSQKILFKIIKKSRLIHFFDLKPDIYSESILNIFRMYGYFLSQSKALPLNMKGEPLPWYTYPTIEYLSQLDLKDKSVFEWGCGNSSLFFANRAKEVFSIEDNLEWYEKISAIKPDNLTLYYLGTDEYVNVICNLNRKFDLIIIDASQRPECAKIALQYLKYGGFVILDNSDWYKKTARIIRDNNMIQVDFHGFGPINNYTWTTSLFFSRDFNFKPKNNVQPDYAIGGLTNTND